LPVESGSGHRIDVHYHVAPPAWADALNRRSLMHSAWNGWSEAKAVEDMDRDGVERSVVSVTTPGVWFGDGAEARVLARACNDYAARLRADHPARFGIFAAVPMPDIDATLAEIAYALDELKVDGIGFLTSYRDKWLGDPAFAPVMAELNRRRALVYVHPTVADCCRNLTPAVHPMLIEYGADTTRAMAQLVFGGEAGRNPDLRLIFSHGGGAMPFVYQRFVSQAQHPHAPPGALNQLRRFYYDTAAAAIAPPMLALRQVVPVSQIVFGTDYPYGTAGTVARQLRESGVFDANEIAAIEHGNARVLFAGAGV
jgi:predicted TIM-barrel fold metal-dependent hydrolase